jgi:hypothetical protein
MSTRIVGTHIAAFLTFVSGIAAGQVAPVPPGVVVGPGAVMVLPAMPRAGPTEVDKAYYYSTIGQELAYAKIREDAASKPANSASNGKPQVGAGLRAPSGVDPLSSAFRPAVSCFCPPPSRLMSRLEAAGYRL